MGQRCPSALDIVDWYIVKGEASIEVSFWESISPAAAFRVLKTAKRNIVILRPIRITEPQIGFEFMFSLLHITYAFRVPLPPLW